MDEKKLNLVIIDDSFDTEEKVVSTLRNQGYAARSTRVEDEEDLAEAIGNRAPELVLYTQGMELISLRQTLDCIQQTMNKAPVPVIVVDKGASESKVVEVMRSGAADLSAYNTMDHLCLVIARELNNYRNWKKTADLQLAFNESERRCSSLLDSSRDAIAYVHEGMHVYSNASYLEMFNIEQADDLEGMPILDMVVLRDRDKFKGYLRDYIEHDKPVEAFSIGLNKPDGTEFEGIIEFSQARVDGEPCVQVVIRQQNQSSEELAAQLKLLSQHDQLTGLFNRQYLLEVLEETISGCETGVKKAAIMEIQLDNFDTIKSQTGVVGADNFIVSASKCLETTTHADDVLARYMHSSFIIIAYDHTAASIEKYAHEIQLAISDHEAQINNLTINTTCTIGITVIDKNSPECSEVLSRAEKAVSEATATGNNQIRVYKPPKGELTRHEVDAKFKGQITEALKQDKFILHYQPIVSLHGDTDERYEVFVRMGSAGNEESLILPQDFLPAAERIGMAIAIDRWVLYRTITKLTERWAKGKKTRFFIKLSAASLKDETLIDWLDYQIKEKKLPKDTLIFEVKESAAVTNLKYAKNLSHKLKAINCGFVLDDFGSGTNPFQLLDHVHADYVRLDKLFMADLLENSANQEIIKKLAEKASTLGKYTIAQYVPDASSLSVLWGMGVNFIQGYFLQEPLPELNYDFTEMSG